MSVINYSGIMCDTVSIHVLVTPEPPHVKLTTGKNPRQAYLYVYLFAYLLVLATSCFNVKLRRYISYIPFLNYFHMCSGIQLKGKTTFMSFLCELYSLMLGENNAFQQIIILITLNISLNWVNVKICSNCSNIVARYAIHKIHQLDSQCPFGHELQ